MEQFVLKKSNLTNIDYISSVYNLNSKIESEYNKILSLYDISYVEFLLLKNIDKETSSRNDLSELLNIAVSNISRSIKKMINKKLITEVKTNNNDRSKYYTSSKRGKDIIDLVDDKLL